MLECAGFDEWGGGQDVTFPHVPPKNCFGKMPCRRRDTGTATTIDSMHACMVPSIMHGWKDAFRKLLHGAWLHFANGCPEGQGVKIWGLPTALEGRFTGSFSIHTHH